MSRTAGKLTSREPRILCSSNHRGTDMPLESDNAPNTTALLRPRATSPEGSKEDGSAPILGGLSEAAMEAHMAAKSNAIPQNSTTAYIPRAAGNGSRGHVVMPRSSGARSAVTTRQLTKAKVAHPRQQHANARTPLRGCTVATKDTP